MKKILALITVLLLLISPIAAIAEKSDSADGSDTVKSEIAALESEDAEESSEAADSGITESGEAVSLVNPSFEDNFESDTADITGWDFESYTDDGSYMELDNGEERGACLHIVCLGKNDVRAVQTVPVKPDTYYAMSVYVKTKGVDGGNGANIAVINSFAYSTPVLGDSDWVRTTLYGHTKSDQTSITLALRIGGYGADSSGEAWFDDVEMTELFDMPSQFSELYITQSSNNDTNKGNENKGDSNSLIIIVAVAVAVVVIAIVIFTSIKGKKQTAPKLNHIKNADDILLKKTDTKLHFTKYDTILLIALTVVYAFVALTHLGTTQAPTTSWIATSKSEPVTITFDKTAEISEVYVFGGIDDGGSIELTYDGENDICTYKQEYGHMFRWHKVSTTAFSADSVTVTAIDSEVDIKEIAFRDNNGNYVIGKASAGGESLVDEPEEIPEEFSSLNGMYFDELYHGRTAYEHLHGLKSYENSHPPLGKIIISIGISIFGMNAFGWRVMGALFGIAMLPILYCFAKYVFKKTSFAFVTTFLFAFDFMHFTQTRIATIDVYGVFFILLMFFFMYKYFTMSFFRDGLLKTLVPLGIAGIFFGLGIASKWICFYAGAGLAILLLISFIMRYLEYAKYKDCDDERYRNAVKGYWKNIILTILFCCVFFIMIPAVIYCASYMVYPDVMEAFKTGGLKGYISRVWYYQDFMFSYHSGLTATHPYQSQWFEWALDLRPMWYSINYFPDGEIATISAMGNPIVWWLSLAGTVGLVIQLIRRKIHFDAPVIMILVGIFSNLLPWVVISRCAFIYHYFATVPFIIMAAAYLLKSLEKEHEWLKYVKWTWVGVAACLFALFYPVIAGIKINESYALNLEWIKSWWFVRGAAAPTNNGVIYGLLIMLLIAAVFIGIGVISYYRYKNKKKGRTEQ